jgi:hypothetical protein
LVNKILVRTSKTDSTWTANDHYITRNTFEDPQRNVWNTAILEKLIVTQLVRKSHTCIELESSLPCSQMHATGPYLETDRFPPNPSSLFLQNSVQYQPLVYAQIFQMVFPSGFYITIVYAFLKLEALGNVSQHTNLLWWKGVSPRSTPNLEYRPLVAVPAAYSVYSKVEVSCSLQIPLSKLLKFNTST